MKKSNYHIYTNDFAKIMYLIVKSLIQFDCFFERMSDSA